MPNNATGDLFVVQGTVPQYTEATRSGTGWNTQTATAFAAFAGVPTTTTRLEIFNNTQGPGAVSLIIDGLWADQILATAVSWSAQIFAMVTTQKAIPTNTALDICSHSGRAKYTTTAAGRIVTAINTTVVENGWRPWGPPMAWGTAAATPGPSWSADVNGRLIVPPQASLCVAIMASVTTASAFQAGASWYEQPLTMVV
jgi:hypothetical protein